MNQKVIMGIIALLLTSPFAWGASVATTNFTFIVPETRALTVAYGGSCTSTNFFFSENNAQFDPDTDGNGAKVRPAAGRNTAMVEDYVGTINPSTRNRAYSIIATDPPASPNSPNIQFTTAEYLQISADDTSYAYHEMSTAGQTATLRFSFNIAAPQTTVTDVNFFYFGQHQSQASCPSGAGIDRDFNMLVWNDRISEFEKIAEFTDGSNLGTFIVPHGLVGIISGSVSDYIDDDQNLTFIISGRTSNGNQQCYHTDYVKLTVVSGGPYCQSATVAPITFTNSGNIDLNIDGNFSAAFAGVDSNLVLKTWMSTGTGCGTDGLGGWEKDCSVTGLTSPVTQTQCKNFNKNNATVGTRLTTKLGVGDVNKLCFSGDFNGFVGAGDHNQVFQTGSDFS